MSSRGPLENPKRKFKSQETMRRGEMRRAVNASRSRIYVIGLSGRIFEDAGNPRTNSHSGQGGESRLPGIGRETAESRATGRP